MISIAKTNALMPNGIDRPVAIPASGRVGVDPVTTPPSVTFGKAAEGETGGWRGS
jgi:hypothetical protein